MTDDEFYIRPQDINLFFGDIVREERPHQKFIKGKLFCAKKDYGGIVIGVETGLYDPKKPSRNEIYKDMQIVPMKDILMYLGFIPGGTNYYAEPRLRFLLKNIIVHIGTSSTNFLLEVK